jgi:hypothetical protein
MTHEFYAATKREICLTLKALAGGWPGLVLVIGFALVTWFVSGR